jgi:hypothetical protein
MSSTPDTNRSRGRGRGRGGRGRGGRDGRWNSGHGSPKTTTSSTAGKLKGVCTELAGYIFGWADYKQADKYMTNMMKWIAEYVGTEFKHGGDIRSTTIENEVPHHGAGDSGTPAAPIIIDATVGMTTAAQTFIFKGKISEYIRRDSILKENMQKAYSLILGQCSTELLKANSNSQASGTKCQLGCL